MRNTDKYKLPNTDWVATGQFQELTIPYWFSSLARERGEALRIRDIVRVRGSHKKYWLVGIYPEVGSVDVMEVGGLDFLNLPWRSVRPWSHKVIRSKTVIQAVGNWFFGRSRVYLLSEPDRMLKQRKIHWDRQSCDVEDEDGNLFYDVSWDDLEFWNPEDYHLPDDE